jgi:DNA-binding transcriptional LysR family regulator
VKIVQDIKMETFITVCDCMNFTRAANRLGLTQPAVSKQMKNLEEYYDVDLFYYEGKKLFLTKAGKTLYRYAKTAHSDSIKLKERLKHEESQKLYIGSTPTPGEYMVPYILSQYLENHHIPDVHIFIKNTESLLEMVDSGEIDLAIVEGNFNKENYEYLLFSKQRFLPVGSKKISFPAHNIESLLSYPLIIREPGSGNREILEHCLKRHNLVVSDFSKVIETNDIRVQKQLVQQGAGIAFMFEAAIKKEENFIQSIDIEGFPLPHEINIVWRKESIFHEQYFNLASYFSKHAY